MVSCTCTSGVGGFGLIDCFGKPSRIVGLGFQNLKSGSSDNYLLAELAQANWEGSLWNKTGSLRISVLNNVKEYTSERADAITETIDEIALYLKDGQKMISFSVLGAPYKLKEYVDGLRCSANGFYGISESGQLLGRRRTNYDELGLIPIQKGTITTKMVDATNTTFSKMVVTFMVDERFDDSEFAYMASDQITADLEYTNALIAAETTDVSITSSTTLDLTLLWAASGMVADNATRKEPLENFDTSSFFLLYNVTTSSTVAISGVTETAPGIYTLTFTAQTAADVLTLSAGTLAPFDFADVTGLVAL